MAVNQPRGQRQIWYRGVEAPSLMTKIKDLHRLWNESVTYKAAYDALDDDFRLARVLIDTRSKAGLSQAELAERMKTSQSYIARIEGGQVHPSTAVLERLAKATGTRLSVTFEPVGHRTKAGVLARLKAQPVRKLKRSAAAIVRAERSIR